MLLIRAHLASVGLPILGDDVYGQPELYTFCPRLFLHCRRLELLALNGQELSLEAPLPADLHDVLDSLVFPGRRGLPCTLSAVAVSEAKTIAAWFPSLINCATVDWYDPWPEDALISVAERYYVQAPKELELDASIAALSKISCVIHASASEAADKFFDELRRKTYMTPTSYLELIKLFTDLLGMKKGELDTKLNRYRVGAQRLKETESVVDKLKVDLTKMQPVIEQGKKDTEKLIVQVDKEEAVAKEAQAACEVDEKEAGEAAATANAIKTECQRELDEALPEYYDAIKALDSLDKKDIQEVKSFAKPPALVEVVLSAVCLLMNKKETWDEAEGPPSSL
ncbi:DNAH6 [Symbiodinium natans]|uniref:DNAH6 protein n=1 Tax=Symbiodinium natans TaxID=878477 RepID=A0A812QCQ6_9DINO|nr:DNAH6 [Symbiodinium natans]